MAGRFLLGIAALLTAAPSVAATSTVNSVQLRSLEQSTQVIVALDRTPGYRLFMLTGPDRVVLDVLDCHLVSSALPLPAGQGSVRQLRAANRSDGSMRLVMDLNEVVDSSGSLQFSSIGGRLVVTLRPHLSAVFMGASPAVSPGTVRAAAANPAPVTAAGYPVPASAAEDSMEWTAVLPATIPGTGEPSHAGRDIVIAVDAGHGGKDPGAHGPNGVLEKDVTLQIAQRLAEIINSQPGMRGVLTRDRDEFIPLRGRYERARAAKADLFISIHADAVGKRDVRGASVYVLNEKGATDEAARQLAARENAADLIGGVSLGDKDPMLRSVLLDVAQNASLSSSIEVGDHILKGIRQVSLVRKPRVLQAPFMVLKSPDVPSVLIETAYISNPTDERNLDDDGYRRRLARAIFTGVNSYFAANPPAAILAANPNPEPAVAGRTVRHIIRRGETLAAVAGRYNISVRDLRHANRLKTDQVAVGQILQIPVSRKT